MPSLGYPTVNNWASDATAIGSLTVGEMISSAEQLRNTRTMQAILDRGGDLKIIIPGVYLFDVSSAPLTLPSNTSLYVGAGVTLKVANGSPSALFTNSAARSAGVPIAGAKASYADCTGIAGYGASSYCVVITNIEQDQAALFPVNSFVSAVVLGHAALGAAGTASHGRGYRGVSRVIEQTLNGSASGLKYLMYQPVFPGSAPSTNPVTLYPANQNIKIWGPGTIDGNGANANQAFNTGNPQGCIMWWRHAYNITVEGLSFLRGVTWTIGSNYVRNYTVRSATMELRTTSGGLTTDFVHLSGNHQNVLITDIDGGSGDNTVGMTIDCTEGTAYDFDYQDPGDVYDVTLNRISGDANSTAAPHGIVAMYGPAAYPYRNITFDEIVGTGSSAVQLSNYAPTNQLLLTIDKLKISNVRAITTGSQVGFTELSVFSINELILDSVISPNETTPSYRCADTATGTIRSLILRNVTFSPYNGAAFTRTQPIVRLGGVDITALQISNTESIVMAANIKCFAADGPANIPKIGIRDCSATGTGTAHLWGDTGAGTAAAPVYNNATYNGTPL